MPFSYHSFPLQQPSPKLPEYPLSLISLFSLPPFFPKISPGLQPPESSNLWFALFPRNEISLVLSKLSAIQLAPQECLSKLPKNLSPSPPKSSPKTHLSLIFKNLYNGNGSSPLSLCQSPTLLEALISKTPLFSLSRKAKTLFSSLTATAMGSLHRKILLLSQQWDLSTGKSLSLYSPKKPNKSSSPKRSLQSPLKATTSYLQQLLKSTLPLASRPLHQSAPTSSNRKKYVPHYCQNIPMQRVNP